MMAAFPNGRCVAGWLILFKAAYLGLLSAALLWPVTPQEQGGANSDLANTGVSRLVTFKSHFLSFDALSYVSLSENGYIRGNRECAFYPLYPLLIRWVSAVTGGHNALVGMALANLFSLVAFLLFYGMAARRFGETTATLALALLLAFPGSLFFQFIYTESLFFLLLMLFCCALEREHWVLAWATGFLLPMIRAVGIFCVFPLLWLAFFRLPPAWWVRITGGDRAARVARWVGPRSDDSLAFKNTAWRGIDEAWLALAPLLGWGAYFLLMRKWTGNAFEGFDAQRQFGVESIHNLLDPVQFVTQFYNPTSWHEFRGSALDRGAFILVVYCLPLIWKLDKSWCLWTVFLGVVPAVSGGFTSFTRFASVVFPLFMALAVFLSRPGLRWLRWFTLAVFATLQVILVWRFVNLGWAG